MTRTILELAASVLLLGSGAIAESPPRNDGSAWPTLHGDLQRSGFYALGTSARRPWSKVD
jgi:hypothetical protein